MKKFLIALSSALAFSVAVGAVPLSDYTTPQTVLAAPYQVATSSETITADGYGRYPAGMPASIAKIQARRAAVVDAQRNLLESIKGVAIDSETTVENFMLKNDVIHSKVSGIIKGAQVISEEALPDGYKVTVAIPVYGVDSVSDVAITAVVGDKAPVPVPQVIPVLSSTPKAKNLCARSARQFTTRQAEQFTACTMSIKNMLLITA